MSPFSSPISASPRQLTFSGWASAVSGSRIRFDEAFLRSPVKSPQGLRIASLAPEDERASAGMLRQQQPRVKLARDAVAAPQGVVHYNVYRQRPGDVRGGASDLAGQPRHARLPRYRRGRPDRLLPRPRGGRLGQPLPSFTGPRGTTGREATRR